MFNNLRHKVMGAVVSAGLIAGLLGTAVPALAAGPTLAVSPAAQSVAAGATFDVAVSVNSTTPVRGFQMGFTFDASKIHVNSVNLGGFLTDWATAHGASVTLASPFAINNTTGSISNGGYSIMGGSAGGATGTGALLTLNVTALANGMSNLNITGADLSDAEAGSIVGLVVTGGAIYIGEPVPMPDLQVTALTFAPVGDGSQYNLGYTVTNAGTQPANASTAAIVIDGGTPITQDISALAAGTSETKTYGPVAVTGGSDTVVANADVTNLVAESNEANNTRTSVYSPATDTGDTTVEAGFGAELNITPPADITNWVLALGDNSKAGTLNVMSNSSWQVDVSDASSTTNWQMTEWNGASYLANKLHNTLHVKCTAEATDVTLSSAPKIADGVVADQSGDAGQDFAISFAQRLQYSDARLTGSNVYRLILTFTGYVTL